MLTVLRIAAVIGVIFYLSPVRERGAPARPLGEVLSGAAEAFGKAAPGAATASADDLWQALPSAAKQKVMDRLLSRPLGSSEAAPADGKPALPRDTLELEDLQPPWRGEAAAGRAAQAHAPPSDGRRRPVEAAPRGAAEKTRP
jgi:hypothetical protein